MQFDYSIYCFVRTACIVKGLLISFKKKKDKNCSCNRNQQQGAVFRKKKTNKKTPGNKPLGLVVILMGD